MQPKPNLCRVLAFLQHTALHCPIPTTFDRPEATQTPLLFASMQWRVQESHLQAELSQTIRDRDEAQKQCADLQRRHAQAQHEIRRKVHSLASALATKCRKARSIILLHNANAMLAYAHPSNAVLAPSCMHAENRSSGAFAHWLISSAACIAHVQKCVKHDSSCYSWKAALTRHRVSDRVLDALCVSVCHLERLACSMLLP